MSFTHFSFFFYSIFPLLPSRRVSLILSSQSPLYLYLSLPCFIISSLPHVNSSLFIRAPFSRNPLGHVFSSSSSSSFSFFSSNCTFNCLRVNLQPPRQVHCTPFIVFFLLLLLLSFLCFVLSECIKNTLPFPPALSSEYLSSLWVHKKNTHHIKYVNLHLFHLFRLTIHLTDASKRIRECQV